MANNKENKNESPPKHRHDGTSPLPLGMDWSPPPKQWDERCSIWPHNPRTGWSYCVMIPSWFVQPNSRTSNGSSLNTVVFFRVLVGIQSPEGVSTSHGVLRRFSDFLKLFSTVKRAFNKKKIPSAPARNSLSNVNASEILLEERRRALEEWIDKLLVDIELSRSAPVAAFLELEAAARSCASVTNSMVSSIWLSAPYEDDISNVISRQGKVNISEVGSKDLESVYSLNSQRKYVRSLSGDSAEFKAVQNRNNLFVHAQSLSAESIGSDLSSVSDLSTSNSRIDGSSDISYCAETCIESVSNTEMPSKNAVLVIHSVDHEQKLKKVLLTIQQKLATAKTDMESLIAQLNQQMTVNEYLKAKVKDLEVELESTEHAYKEDLREAILQEREKVTKIQWDTVDMHRKYMEIESKIKFEQGERARAELETARAEGEKMLLQKELEYKTELLEDLQRHQEELGRKSRSDIRVLVKEIKSLRSSQEELKEVLNQHLKKKIELERFLQKEKQKARHIKLMRMSLLDECGVLRHRLQESSVNFLSEGENKFTVDPSSLSDALGLLSTSDTRISILLTKTQVLGQDDGSFEVMDGTESSASESIPTNDSTTTSDDEMTSDYYAVRKMLSESIVDGAILRKQINSVVRCALKTIIKPLEENSVDTKTRKTALDKFLRR